MTLVVAHPTGNANVRAVLRGVVRAGLLDSFWTSIAVPPALVSALPAGSLAARELARREFGEVPWGKIRVAPRRETLRLAATRFGAWRGTRGRAPGGWHATRPADPEILSGLGTPRGLSTSGGLSNPSGLGISAVSAVSAASCANAPGPPWSRKTSVDAVYRHLDRSVARYLRRAAPPEVDAVYAYEDGALETFRAAEDTGRRKLYELPIAHWRTVHAILAGERERHPAWAGTIRALQDRPEKLFAKDAELTAADLVVVASSFARQSVEAAFGGRVKVVVVPYGAPALHVARPARRAPDAPLKILFAGHLDARKGLPDLIAALEMLDVPWTATLAGRCPEHPPGVLRAFLGRENVGFLGHVPHRTLMSHMTTAHAFVLPSLVEGFGLVLAEAMAAGLVVVTTPHTAGPDLIADGRDGFIVPVRDPAAIAARLTLLHDDEPGRLGMATAALRAAAAAPWRAYEDTVAALALAACR